MTEKCGVIIDQRDRLDIECGRDAVMSNEGVELCLDHADAYSKEGLLLPDTKLLLHALLKYPCSFSPGDRVRVDRAGHCLHGDGGQVVEQIGQSTRVMLDRPTNPAIPCLWFPWGFLVNDPPSKGLQR